MDDHPFRTPVTPDFVTPAAQIERARMHMYALGAMNIADRTPLERQQMRDELTKATDRYFALRRKYGL